MQRIINVNNRDTNFTKYPLFLAKASYRFELWYVCVSQGTERDRLREGHLSQDDSSGAARTIAKV